MQRILATAVLLGLLATTAGCGGDAGPGDATGQSSEPPAASPADLEGTRWQLDTLRDGAKEMPAPRGTATINFDKEGKIGVNSYCNVGGGSVKIGDGTMKFGAIMMTMRACADPARARAESALTAVLSGKVTYQLEGETLRITKGEQSLGFSAS